jgi:hypothetical protein
MLRRHEIPDDRWDRIEGLLQGQPSDPDVHAEDNRLFLNRPLDRQDGRPIATPSLEPARTRLPGRPRRSSYSGTTAAKGRGTAILPAS